MAQSLTMFLKGVGGHSLSVEERYEEKSKSKVSETLGQNQATRMENLRRQRD